MLICWTAGSSVLHPFNILDEYSFVAVVLLLVVVQQLLGLGSLTIAMVVQQTNSISCRSSQLDRRRDCAFASRGHDMSAFQASPEEGSKISVSAKQLCSQ